MQTINQQRLKERCFKMKKMRVCSTAAAAMVGSLAGITTMIVVLHLEKPRRMLSGEVRKALHELEKKLR